jgi:hypothetical protein
VVIEGLVLRLLVTRMVVAQTEEMKGTQTEELEGTQTAAQGLGTPSGIRW